MQKSLSFAVILLMAVTTWAQNPKLSYQAVVRDSQNRLITEKQVTVTVNILDANNVSDAALANYLDSAAIVRHIHDSLTAHRTGGSSIDCDDLKTNCLADYVTTNMLQERYGRAVMFMPLPHPF